MRYRCRFIVPSSDVRWYEVEGESPEDAALNFHYREVPWCGGPFYVPHADRPGLRVYFARVEVEGHGEHVVSTISSSIVRKGVKSRATLADIAKALDWPDEPERLMDGIDITPEMAP